MAMAIPILASIVGYYLGYWIGFRHGWQLAKPSRAKLLLRVPFGL